VKEEPAEFDLLKHYLLGQLAETQMCEIERRYLTDEVFFQTLLQVESMLINQYARGQLSPEECERVETHFLHSAERCSRVKFVKLRMKLADMADARQGLTRAKCWRRWMAWLGYRR